MARRSKSRAQNATAPRTTDYQADLRQINQLFAPPDYQGTEPIERNILGISGVTQANTIYANSVSLCEPEIYVEKEDGQLERADHPSCRILETGVEALDGHCQVSARTGRWVGVTDCSFRGNTVWETIRNGRGQCVDLKRVSPRSCSYVVTDRGERQIHVSQSNGIVKLTPFEYFHIPMYPIHGFEGFCPSTLARNSMNLSLLTQEYPRSFYKRGRPLGFLSKDGMLKQGEAEEVRENFEASNAGIENAFRVAILGGGLKWNDISLSPEDEKFLGTRKFQIYEIARWFNLPPHFLFNLDTSTYNNIEQLGLFFVTYSLAPLLAKWEAEYERVFFTVREKFKYRVRFDTTRLLEADTKTKWEAIERKVRNGILTIDEIRDSLGKPRYKGQIGSEPLILASQLATLRDVYDGKVNTLTQSNNSSTDSSTNKQTDNTSQSMANQIISSLHNLTKNDLDRIAMSLDIARGYSPDEIMKRWDKDGHN